MNLRTIIGLALIAGGAVLLYFGYQESNSLASDVSEVFTGSPTDRTIWLIAGGAVVAVLGLGVTLTGRAKS